MSQNQENSNFTPEELKEIAMGFMEGVKDVMEDAGYENVKTEFKEENQKDD